MTSPLQKNFFELLGLPVAFNIDEQLLEANYLKLQQVFHPDKYAGASSAEQRVAVQITSELNAARSCLLNEVQRAKYLLSLNDVHVADEQTISDMDFLMQQMQWREQLESLNSADTVANFKQDMQSVAQSFSTEFVQAFEQKAWDKSQLVLAKMQFMQKLLRECESKTF